MSAARAKTKPAVRAAGPVRWRVTPWHDSSKTLCEGEVAEGPAAAFNAKLAAGRTWSAEVEARLKRGEPVAVYEAWSSGKDYDSARYAVYVDGVEGRDEIVATLFPNRTVMC